MANEVAQRHLAYGGSHMIQHHYLFDSLDDLQKACYELEHSLGIDRSRLHVVVQNDLAIEQRNLNGVGPFGESDMVHTGLRAGLLGIPVALVTGGLTWQFVTHDELGGVIAGFVFLLTLGFCTWLGGMVGASHENWRISAYHDDLEQGKSLLLVDVEPNQEQEMMITIATNYRDAVHCGESSSLESPLEGGWNLHLRKHKDVA